MLKLKGGVEYIEQSATESMFKYQDTNQATQREYALLQRYEHFIKNIHWDSNFCY